MIGLNEELAAREAADKPVRIGLIGAGEMGPDVVAQVEPGVLVIVTTDHPRLREALILRDMGTGPYYTLCCPYHLCSIEVPLICAMLVIRGRSNMAPLEHLMSEVFAVAKEDLQTGDVLDGIGGCTFYSLIDRYEVARREKLLPISLAKGAKVTRSVPKDRPLTFADVELQQPFTVLSLRRLQDAWMVGEKTEEQLLTSVNELNSD